MISLDEFNADYNVSYTDILYFYIPTSTVTVKEEFLVYDWVSFVADCGGMGGILLGLSLLAGYQAFVELIQWLYNGLGKVQSGKD